MDFSAELPYGLIGSGAVQQLANDVILPSSVLPSSSSTPSAMAFFRNKTVCKGPTSHEELYGDRDFNRASSIRAGEDDSATPSTSPSRSPSPSPPSHRTLLDKPLEQLTEEDIMHLTREDCRRYLKQKGMRRPSWNKSQAIQQVLSLKGLFDSKDDDERSVRPLSSSTNKLNAEPSCVQEFPDKSRGVLYTSQMATAARSQQSSSTINVGKEVFANSGKACQTQERKDVHVTHQPDDSQRKHSHAKVSRVIEVSSRSSPAHMDTNQITATSLELKESYSSPQKMCSQCAQAYGLPGMEQSTQLTIFYSGMVNVYDNVPEDKARAVMLLAERSNKLGPLLCTHMQNSTNLPMQGVNASSWPMTQYVHSTVANAEVSSTTSCPSISVPAVQSFKTTQLEHNPSRKACLQRYLEKRRGRYNVRSSCAPSVKRVDGNLFSSQLMSETYKFSSFLEMVDPSSGLHHNSSQVQLSTQSSSGSETSSSPPLRSCPSS